MRLEVAAAYLGLSESAFQRVVGSGKLPQPRWITRGRKIWLKDELDDFLDRLFEKSGNTEAQAWLDAAERAVEPDQA